MTSLAIDDHITIVLTSMTLCLVVEKVERKAFFCMPDDDLPDIGGWRLNNDDEGSLWIRGWHTPDSEEVKAARVAQGIGNDKKRRKRPTYKELEEQVKRAEAEADNVRKLLDEMKRQAEQERRRTPVQYPWRVDTQINPCPNESYSDAAWRKLKGY